MKSLIKKVPGAQIVARRLRIARKGNVRTFVLDMFPRDSIGAEIGVHKGDFARKMIDEVAPSELYLIDPWEHQTSETYREAWFGGKALNGQTEMDERHDQVCRRFNREIATGQVLIRRGYSSDMLEQFPDEYFDWVYIDGNHLYEYVKSDLEISLRKTKHGGFIAGDDYKVGGWWQSGVKEAVDEFTANGDAELVTLRNGQFVFRRR
ncbi:MAG: class I SAM-dependent methyltransferase [Planctomycetota bacterium]